MGWHGLPDKRSGVAIPLLAQILAVRDGHAALSSARRYKKVWGPEAVQRKLQFQIGRHCPPRMIVALDAVLRCLP